MMEIIILKKIIHQTFFTISSCLRNHSHHDYNIHLHIYTKIKIYFKKYHHSNYAIFTPRLLLFINKDLNNNLFYQLEYL